MNAIRAMTFERYTPVFYEDEEEDAEDFEGFEGATLLDNDNDDPEEDENGCYPLSRCPTRPPSSPCHNCIVLSAHLSELETATTDTLEVTKKSLEETQDKLKKTEAQSQSYQTQMEDYKTKMESYKTNNEDLVKEHVKLKKEKWELRRLVGDGTGTTRRKMEAVGGTKMGLQVKVSWGMDLEGEEKGSEGMAREVVLSEAVLLAGMLVWVVVWFWVWW